MKAEKTRGDHRIFKPVFIERSCPDLRHGGGSKKRRFQSVSADCGKWIFRYIVWPVSSGIVEKIPIVWSGISENVRRGKAT